MSALKLLVSIVVITGLAACATTPPDTPQQPASAIVERINNASAYDPAHGKCPAGSAAYCQNPSGVLLGEARSEDCTCVPRDAMRRRFDSLYR